jgi:hypothetical protein
VHDETGIALVADATKILQAGEEPGKVASVEPEKDALTLSLETFARLVGQGGASTCTAVDALRATAVAIRAHEATLTNARLEIPPIDVGGGLQPAASPAGLKAGGYVRKE